LLSPLIRVPLYKLARSTRIITPLPINLTVSVTYRCNSRCKTCNIYLKKADEFSAEEFDKAFHSLGKVPYWFTLSGGEPFLRKDLPDIARSAYNRNLPGIINIPTNGLLVDRIVTSVEEIARDCRNTQIIINLSMDDIGERHDEIRGVPGNFDRLMETYRQLKEVGAPNLVVGIHTVVSKYNVDRIKEIADYVSRELKPDSFITEIAEERVELDTMGMDITPSADLYGAAIDHLSGVIRAGKHRGISKITQAFRLDYYQLVKRTLVEKRQMIPCFAGLASAQIAPDGDVWMCCIRGESIGNLRDHGYDFKAVWRTEEAGRQRASIRRGECYCPLANAGYTNMLCNLGTLTKVAASVARPGRS
jgi:MoaA/NifB/PqqE/SkfB family radical SAM enzyme